MSQNSDQRARETLEKEFRENVQRDLGKLFERLDEMNARLQVLQNAPQCPDPGACKRMEVALTDQNRRLVALELARQRTLGELTAVGTMCTILGAVVGWIIEWSHK